MLAVEALELSFIILLGTMTAATGLFAFFVVVRVLEPRGFKALRARMSGKRPVPGFRPPDSR